MFPFNITTKLLGFVSGGLALALVLASSFGWLQTTRLTAAKETITALKNTVTIAIATANDNADQVAERDGLIEAQNAAVIAIQATSEANRTAYRSRIVAAEKLAASYQAQAKDVMSRKALSADELERCREAKALIQEMIGAPTP